LCRKSWCICSSAPSKTRRRRKVGSLTNYITHLW
jgi:hypothetical protein